MHRGSPAETADQGCGFLEESLSAPRGIPLFCTGFCTCVHNRVIIMEELEDDSRMRLGQIRELHSGPPFILESPSRHPHAATPPCQGIRRDSTESTAPTTTSVLLLERSLFKTGCVESRHGHQRHTGARPTGAQSRTTGSARDTTHGGGGVVI